jgi:UDP-glucose 4-epimerase
MKKILLTGSEGFVGRNLLETLSHRDDFVLCAPRQSEINLTDSNDVAQCIEAFQPDLIIHSATSNTVGKGYDADVCEQNLRMFFNLLRYRPQGCLFYTLCSGSSYNRESWIPKMSEDYLGVHIPTDSQGFSKFVIASYARHLVDVVTLRIFGIFGKYEDYRYKFISNTIAKRLSGLEVTLFRDAVYDYLDVADFCEIVERLVDRNVRSGEFNVTPDNSIKLSQAIEAVDRCLGINQGYQIVTSGLGKTYTGCNKNLRAVLKDYEFSPIDVSIQRLINHYTENKQQIDAEALRNDQLLQHAKSINSP